MKLLLINVLVLAVTLMVTVAQSNPVLEQMSSADKVKFTQSARFISAVGRGFITGYRKGMYKLQRYSIDPQCFDNKTQQAFISSFSKWGTP